MFGGKDLDLVLFLCLYMDISNTSQVFTFLYKTAYAEILKIL